MYNFASKGKVLKMCLGNELNITKNETFTDVSSSFEKKNYILNLEQKKALEDLNSYGKKFNVSVLD